MEIGYCLPAVALAEAGELEILDVDILSMRPLATAYLYQARPLLIAGAVVVILAAVQPFLWKYVASSARGYQDKRTQAQQLRLLEDRLSLITQAIDRDRPLLRQLNASLLSRGSESQAVERIEQLADREGVILTTQSINERKQDASDTSKILTPLDVVVQVQGEPAKLLQYIDAVEHMQEVVHIQQITMKTINPTPGKEKTTTNAPVSAELSMTITFYIQNAPRT